MATVPTDYQGAENSIDLEERYFVASPAISQLVASSHVHLGVFMNDVSLRIDDVRDV
jgi:hypothetical protein